MMWSTTGQGPRRPVPTDECLDLVEALLAKHGSLTLRQLKARIALPTDELAACIVQLVVDERVEMSVMPDGFGVYRLAVPATLRRTRYSDELAVR